jgi:uncharacterized protein
MLAPLSILSLPAAFVGGLVVLDARIYGIVTGLVLLLSAGLLVFRASVDSQRQKRPPVLGSLLVGGAVGFVSGLTGVGGGIFLAPVLIVLGWASPRQTATLSAPFILANSITGLPGALYAVQHLSQDVWLYARLIDGSRHRNGNRRPLDVAGDDTVHPRFSSLRRRPPAHSRGFVNAA